MRLGRNYLGDGYNSSVREYLECARVTGHGGREKSAFFVVYAHTGDREIHSNISHDERRILYPSRFRAKDYTDRVLSYVTDIFSSLWRKTAAWRHL